MLVVFDLIVYCWFLVGYVTVRFELRWVGFMLRLFSVVFWFVLCVMFLNSWSVCMFSYLVVCVRLFCCYFLLFT